MKVFLAWSGASSHHVARLLHGWLPDVIQSVEPFMSSEDIRTGTRWFNEIGTQLEQTNFGILCATPANLDSTWMHFEAGAVSKNVTQARVCAFLFELKPTELKLPLSQFQHSATNLEGVKKLMLSIDDASDKKLGRDRVERAVETNWDRLQAGLNEARAVLAEERRGRDVPLRRSEEILSDILDTQQGVLTRLQSIEELLPQRRSPLSPVFFTKKLAGFPANTILSATDPNTGGEVLVFDTVGGASPFFAQRPANPDVITPAKTDPASTAAPPPKKDKK